MKKYLLLFLLCAVGSVLNAQPFTDLQNGFPTLGNASTSIGDYDNDGDMDFAVIGFSGISAETGQVYRNDGNGVFTLVYTLSVPVASGSVSWGDFDNDNDLDLLANGQTGTGPVANTTIYRYDGNNVFTPLTNMLPGIIGTTRWIDYDNDGWLDVLLAGIGITLTNDSILLFHNNTNGTFSNVPINLPGIQPSDIAIVDFDNDNDMDFFLTGGHGSPTVNPQSLLYRNDGSAVFVQEPFAFKNVCTGTISWKDYDSDGDKDLLYCGMDSSSIMNHTRIYLNDGGGNFSMVNVNLVGAGEPGSADWADMDNDGDLDILLGGPTTLLRNDGGNVFIDITPSTAFQSVPCAFINIDNDNDQDLLFISQTGGMTASSIYRNDNINSVNEINANDYFSVYPNPTHGIINLFYKNSNVGELNISLVNSLGEVVLKENNNSVVRSISVEGLSAGVYYLLLEVDGGQLFSQKIIIE